VKKVLKKDTGVAFYVAGDYNEHWFSRHNSNIINIWEQDTFKILEYYKNKSSGVYVDIGAWIGPTVLYAANIYKEVIAVEPDPIAIKRLEENLSVNKFTNVKLVKKGLAAVNGTAKFGGHGPLGNSESTLLVSEPDYTQWGYKKSLKRSQDALVIIDTITIENLLTEQSVDPAHISLIKMDIEGGELFVVPAIQRFLKEHQPAFYISLHYGFLNIEHIESILDVLFSIYNNCYVFSSDGKREKVSRDNIINNKIEALVFETN